MIDQLENILKERLYHLKGPHLTRETFPTTTATSYDKGVPTKPHIPNKSTPINPAHISATGGDHVAERGY